MKVTKRFIKTGLLLVTLISFTGCGQKTRHKNPEQTALQTEEMNKNITSFRGVIKENDNEAGEIVFVNHNYDNEIVLKYSDATVAINKNGSRTPAELMEPGSIVDVDYEIGSQHVEHMEMDSEAWVIEGATDWEADTNKRIFTIADVKYKYNDTLVVVNDGRLVDVMCLNRVDKLRISGVGKKIYSINVLQGHGYIRPYNYDDFVGGTVSVGYIFNQPVMPDMLLVVPEGTYDVTMKFGNLTGTRTVQVERDAEASLDMDGFAKKGQENEGQVLFDIYPEGADVFVNGRQIDYRGLVPLSYGQHNVTVALSGYTTYKGTLTVNSPNPTVTIDLIDEVAEVNENGTRGQRKHDEKAVTATPEVTRTPVNDYNSTDIWNTKEPEITPVPSAQASSVEQNTSQEEKTATQDESEIVYDKEHVIKISGPEGAQVYLNGAYKGIAPCSFPKQIGTQTVTISNQAGVNESYTIVIKDDGKDVTWTFPELN